MNDTFDRELRDLLGSGPRIAPSAFVDAALREAGTTAQRRPRFTRLDRQAWPPMPRSIGDPALRRAARLLAVALLVVLIAAVVAIGARLLDPPPRVTVESAGELNAYLQDPQAVLWPDGRIFVRGATRGDFMYDPHTGTTSGVGSWVGFPGSPFPQVLPNGRVGLLGSLDGEVVTVGFYDPVSDTTSAAGTFPDGRFADSELVLRDGRVIVSGGADFDEATPVYFATVAVFDPATGVLSELAPLRHPRIRHSMLELDDGRVLIVGGGSPESPTGEALDVEVYDLRAETSKIVGSISSGLGPFILRPIPLADGRVLIQGGGRSVEPCPSPHPPSGEPAGFSSVHAIYRQDTYVFDPADDSFLAGPELPHFTSNVVALGDGRAVAFGAHLVIRDGCASDEIAYSKPWLGVIDLSRGIVFESRDPTTGDDTLSFDLDRAYADAVLLPDGRLAMIADTGETKVKNVVDLVTIGP